MNPTSLCLQSLRLARSKSISFIGLGQMGREMAANLFSKRFDEDAERQFHVCDANLESVLLFSTQFKAKHPQAKIEISQTPEEAVRASQTVITMLPSSPQVKAVYTEAAGIMQALRSFPEDGSQSTLFIDSTTLDVDVARGVAREVIATGAQMVDAPVSGGVTGAKLATLSFLVGGTDAAFTLSQPVLAHMGRRVIHCGLSGAGLGAKICNNLVLGVEQIVVAEAMLLGQKLGLDPAVLASVINSSTGGCWSSSVNNPVPSALPEQSPPCERDYAGGFATALMMKDMGLATNIASNTGSSLPLGEAAEHIYASMIKEHPELARKDFSSVYLYLRAAADAGKRVHLLESAA